MRWIWNHGFWRRDTRQIIGSQIAKVKFGQRLKDGSKQAGVGVLSVTTYNLKR